MSCFAKAGIDLPGALITATKVIALLLSLEEVCRNESWHLDPGLVFFWCWLLSLVTLCKLLDSSLQHCHSLIRPSTSPEAAVHGDQPGMCC